jgi:FAD:protein FMN transferase
VNAAAVHSGPLRRIGFRALGCAISIAVEEQAGHAPLERLPTWFHSCERALSRFHSDSELSQLNGHPCEPIPASPLLWHAMLAALEAAQWTDGLVHPAMLPALERAGYDRDFAQLAVTLSGKQASPEPMTRDWHDIAIDERAHTITLPEGMRLDFGGTAKGWIADHVVAALTHHGPALVNAGGDIAICGSSSRRSWPIGILDPLHPGETLGRVHVQAGGIATSGRDHRRWQVDQQWQHHIIDPRTGAPAVTDVLSATVVGPSAFAAEVAAKVVLLRGCDDGIAWLEQQDGFAGLVVKDDGSLVPSRAFVPIWTG